MRCKSCDTLLNDFEATRKYEDGEYVDMCNSCFRKSDQDGVSIIERDDLKEYEDVDDDDVFDLFMEEL